MNSVQITKRDYNRLRIIANDLLGIPIGDIPTGVAPLSEVITAIKAALEKQQRYEAALARLQALPDLVSIDVLRDHYLVFVVNAAGSIQYGYADPDLQVACDKVFAAYAAQDDTP